MIFWLLLYPDNLYLCINIFLCGYLYTETKFIQSNLYYEKDTIKVLLIKYYKVYD